MDIVLGLDAAERDHRVKGVSLRIGSANLSIAEAEEIGTAIKSIRKSGKFVIAHSQGFLATGLGDYLTAASADQIWMQPNAPFTAAGEGGGQLFCADCSTKFRPIRRSSSAPTIKAQPISTWKRTWNAGRPEQLTRLMQSWYDTAGLGAAAGVMFFSMY